MKEDINRIEGKVDTMLQIQNDMRVDIAKVQKDIGRNTDDVKEHIRRTNLLEQSTKKDTDKLNNKLQYIIYLLIAGAGATGVVYGPEMLTIIKAILI